MCGILIRGNKCVRTGSGRRLAYASDIVMLGHRGGDNRRAIMDSATEKGYPRKAFNRHLEFIK